MLGRGALHKEERNDHSIAAKLWAVRKQVGCDYASLGSLLGKESSGGTVGNFRIEIELLVRMGFDPLNRDFRFKNNNISKVSIGNSIQRNINVAALQSNLRDALPILFKRLYDYPGQGPCAPNQLGCHAQSVKSLVKGRSCNRCATLI